ncbi:hypothetical protein LTR86_003740 [Recurvomyces mirabilis]|nr:hypothetical protein LTR86_003740 [Recurvomyces mirabilis]
MTIQQILDDDRAQLTKRSIPHMVLSSGDASSLTPAPAQKNCPVSEGNNQASALNRFAINGNAIVTGGTGTLGLASCNALLEHGLSHLAIFDLNIASSEGTIAELQGRFPKSTVMGFDVDVTDEVAVEAAVEQVSSHFGAINHLLCFSGIVGCFDALSTPTANWRRILDVNTTGAFICAQAVAKRMVGQQSGGSIMFTASISAHRVNYPQPQAAYNVSKAALITLKNCLAAEWACYGIRTNTISPGYMDTILNEGDGIADARRIWEERNPTGRLGAPSELTGAVVMLASSSSTYINGCDIVVDGGGSAF